MKSAIFWTLLSLINLSASINNALIWEGKEHVQISEYLILTYFKQEIENDPQNAVQNWSWGNRNPCTLSNVKCNKDNKVTGIYLGGKRITGKLTLELGLLQDLQVLDLSNNNFYGTVPSMLGNLKNLATLKLNNNKLSGRVPSPIGNLTALKFLKEADFSNNDKNLCWDFWPTPIYKGSYTICQA